MNTLTQALEKLNESYHKIVILKKNKRISNSHPSLILNEYRNALMEFLGSYLQEQGFATSYNDVDEIMKFYKNYHIVSKEQFVILFDLNNVCDIINNKLTLSYMKNELDHDIYSYYLDWIKNIQEHMISDLLQASA